MKEIEGESVDLDSPDTLKVFDNLTNDIALTCIKILEDISRRKIKREDGLKYLEELKKIIFNTRQFDDEDKNMIMEFVKGSLFAIINSTEYKILGKKTTRSVEDLVREAIISEKRGDLDKALDIISRIGAMVLQGRELPEINLPEEDLVVLNWYDGIETLNTLLITMKMDEAGG